MAVSALDATRKLDTIHVTQQASTHTMPKPKLTILLTPLHILHAQTLKRYRNTLHHHHPPPLFVERNNSKAHCSGFVAERGRKFK